jgi:glutaredoxin 3
VFSKSWCPYSKKAKALLKEKYSEVEAEIFESVNFAVLVGAYADGSLWLYRLDERPDGSDIQNYLFEKTGQRTVPNVFISAY